jgi:DNA-directed RNA polymerase II subunit RPB1
MASAEFPHSSAPLKTIKFIQFGILAPEETKSLSIAKIDSMDLFESIDRPKAGILIALFLTLAGGLLDPRLGTIDRNFKCQTCGESMTDWYLLVAIC